MPRENTYKQFGSLSEANTAAVWSIADSMKRIADAIEGTPSKLGMTDGIMHAIEQGILAARNG